MNQLTGKTNKQTTEHLLNWQNHFIVVADKQSVLKDAARSSNCSQLERAQYFFLSVTSFEWTASQIQEMDHFFVDIMGIFQPLLLLG